MRSRKSVVSASRVERQADGRGSYRCRRRHRHATLDTADARHHPLCHADCSGVDYISLVALAAPGTTFQGFVPGAVLSQLGLRGLCKRLYGRMILL